MKKLLPRLIVSLLLLAGLAWHLDWPALGALLARADVGLAILAFGGYLGCQGLSAWRWQWLARPLGFTDDYPRFLALYLVGMCFNLILPTSVGGDVVKVWHLGGKGQRGAALLAVLVDRGNGLGMLIALAALAACVSPIPLPPGVGPMLGALLSAVILGPILAIWLAPTLAEHRFGWLPTFLCLKARHLAGLTAEAVRVYRARPGTVAVSLGLSTLVQSGNVLVAVLLAASLGVSVPTLYLAVAVLMVTVLTLLPVSVNGVGVREAGMCLFLASVGVSTTDAVALSLLTFGVAVVGGLLGAVVCGLGWHRSATKTGTQGELILVQRAA